MEDEKQPCFLDVVDPYAYRGFVAGMFDLFLRDLKEGSECEQERSAAATLA